LNLPILADLAQGHALISPTEWQRSQFPSVLRDKIAVIPDGVDLDIFKPAAEATFEMPDGRHIGRSDRIVTYAARGADPFRGFAQFLEALARLQARDPDLEAIVLGDRKVYYGPGVGSEAYYEEVLAKVSIDRNRTHFLGKLSYEKYLTLLQISSAHVYLTAPFVLSWSCLEAMAAGCAMIGSNTAPVREFITHGENGLLASFFDSEELALQIERAREGGPQIERLRENARRTIEDRWSAERAVKQHLGLVDELLARPK
jgi:glycosyltransferase involved in cell wall biosynthesis